jgi:alkylation response protein AidB-like acyl-CoA dehydrogenase
VEETPEQLLVRDSVRKIAQSFGHSYYVEQARSGGKADELWSELGRAGFIGVNLPEEFDGGGMGTAELAIVSEEISAAGPPRHCSVLGDG